MALKRPSATPPGHGRIQVATGPSAKKTAAKKAPAKKGVRKKAAAKTAPARQRQVVRRAESGTALGSTTILSQQWDPEGRTSVVVRMSGGVRPAAELLGVDPAQASRWARGQTAPSPHRARVLLDVEHVMAMASLLWATSEGIADWLNTPNAHLDGIRPITKIHGNRTAEVVDALGAEIEGAYA